MKTYFFIYHLFTTDWGGSKPVCPLWDHGTGVTLVGWALSPRYFPTGMTHESWPNQLVNGTQAHSNGWLCLTRSVTQCNSG